jgi:twitching motility protein PilT
MQLDSLARAAGEAIMRSGEDDHGRALPDQCALHLARSGQFSKIQTALETGGNDGSFTFSRYREWLEKRSDWHVPSAHLEKEHTTDLREPESLPSMIAYTRKPAPGKGPRVSKPAAKAMTQSAPRDDGVLEIHADDDLASILSELEDS